ncbi:hypothetical protein HYH03_007814 [Edaphochlamys debaryana]|uniref:phytol kinase n=1 Tax=Edaphochlamys debaryana TaxID=47281 RepID=A0A835Y0Y8_9CHLO|nr:hypothetical protein HYH03_007814 [Edaphochlamys debaryana]|eukprot:KAG2493876.1 hypothetical protein HYH03_007814 [Edaphochlamys debaryana]
MAGLADDEAYDTQYDHLPYMLAYGAPRQAAALVVTLGKTLSAMTPSIAQTILFEPWGMQGAVAFSVLEAIEMLWTLPRDRGVRALLEAAASGSILWRRRIHARRRDGGSPKPSPSPSPSASPSKGGAGGAQGGAGGASAARDAAGGAGSISNSNTTSSPSASPSPSSSSGAQLQLGAMLALAMASWLPSLSRLLQAALAHRPSVPKTARGFLTSSRDRLPKALIGFMYCVSVLVEVGYPKTCPDSSSRERRNSSFRMRGWAQALLGELCVGAVLVPAMELLAAPPGKGDAKELHGWAAESVLHAATRWLAAGGDGIALPRLLKAAGKLREAYVEAGDVQGEGLVQDLLEEARTCMEEGGVSGPARPHGAAPADLVPPCLPADAVLPVCGNPACKSMAGDSEADVRLAQCSRCKVVGYCCNECQSAHWRRGHKEECGRRRRRRITWGREVKTASKCLEAMIPMSERDGRGLRTGAGDTLQGVASARVAGFVG